MMKINQRTFLSSPYCRTVICANSSAPYNEAFAYMFSPQGEKLKQNTEPTLSHECKSPYYDFSTPLTLDLNVAEKQLNKSFPVCLQVPQTMNHFTT